MPTPSVTVSVRLSVPDYERLTALASAAGMAPSAYMRDRALRLGGTGVERLASTPEPAEWKAKLAAKAAPESRSTGPAAPARRRSPVASTPPADTVGRVCLACEEPGNGALVHSYTEGCRAEPKAVPVKASKEAIVADLKEKVAAVEAAGKGLQGPGPDGEADVLDSDCSHPTVKAVQGSSGAVVKVCQECGERGL